MNCSPQKYPTPFMSPFLLQNEYWRNFTFFSDILNCKKVVKLILGDIYIFIVTYNFAQALLVYFFLLFPCLGLCSCSNSPVYTSNELNCSVLSQHRHVHDHHHEHEALAQHVRDQTHEVNISSGMRDRK